MHFVLTSCNICLKAEIICFLIYFNNLSLKAIFISKNLRRYTKNHVLNYETFSVILNDNKIMMLKYFLHLVKTKIILYNCVFDFSLFTFILN